MEHRRYGKFKAKYYIGAIVAMVWLLFLVIMVIVMKLSLWFIVLPLLVLVRGTSVIIKRYTERFFISGNEINLYCTLTKNKKKIIIPDSITVIISYADLPTPFTRQTYMGGIIRPLKEQYSITLLHKMPIEQILNRLHKNSNRIYTNALIRAVFEDYLYIYDCVYGDEILKDILLNRDCFLIIPESLQERIFSVSENGTTIIDKGY